jgi:Flp pilus assembly protein TadD
VARELSPGDRQVQLNLAGLLVRTGRFAAAEEVYMRMLEQFPRDVTTRGCLADVLVRQGRRAEALSQLSDALSLDPDSVDVLNNLAWELATSPQTDLRDAPRAVTLAQHACELTHHQKVICLGTLAAAYAAAGRFEEAMDMAQRACDLASKNGEADLLANNRELLERYRQHQTAR